MSDALAVRYLQNVLTLGPNDDAETIVRRRREYVHSTDVFVADLADDGAEQVDLGTVFMRQLLAIRRDFWTLQDVDLAGRLSALRNVNHVATATAATRLGQVAAQRDAIRQLPAQPGVHPAFVRSFAEVLIAPASDANQLREREHRFMRPEQNPNYEVSRRAIQGTAHLIRQHHPALFALEEAWLTELLEYNPIEETEHESANQVLGCAMLIGLGLTLLAILGIIGWIFR
jgi:hypothetical protein